MSVGRQITTRRNFHLKSLPPDVNPLAVIIESAVMPGSVRRHEAKASRQLWTYYHMRGEGDTDPPPKKYAIEKLVFLT